MATQTMISNVEQIIRNHQTHPAVVALGRLQFWATTVYTWIPKGRRAGLDGQIVLQCRSYHGGLDTPAVLEIPLTPEGPIRQIEHDFGWDSCRDCIGRYVKRNELFDFTLAFDPN